jgi:hypothetical protein
MFFPYFIAFINHPKLHELVQKDWYFLTFINVAFSSPTHSCIIIKFCLVSHVYSIECCSDKTDTAFD